MNGTNVGILAKANTYLSSLAGWNTSGAHSLTFYGNATKQDFLTATLSAVSVPAALPLFASAIAGFGMIRRRTKSS